MNVCFNLQVRLFLDLNDKLGSGLIREELRYSDIYETIDLIVSQFDSCTQLLKVKPIFKKHYENFDKILKVNAFYRSFKCTFTYHLFISFLDFDTFNLHSQCE